MNVLIIDDDRHQVDSIRRGLAMHGHDARAVGVAGAAEVLEALQALQAGDPRRIDVAIVDLGVVSGNRLPLVLRALRMLPPLPVLVIAGLCTPPDLEAARRMGVSILRKPFDATRLDRAIRDAVEREVNDRRNPR